MTPKRRKTRLTVPRPDRASNPTIPFLHSLAAMGDERWDEAIAALHRFLGLIGDSPDRLVAHQNLGACYLALERFDEALAALDEVERLQPEDPDVFYSRGVTCACAARLPEAIAVFELLKRRWPQQARQYEVKEDIQQLGRIQSGKLPPGTYLLEHLKEQIGINTDLGDFHLVEHKARRMIAAVPERPEGHFALGIACLEQDRYPEALESFQAAHARDPRYKPTIYNIGHTCLKLERPAEALVWLERALRRNPKNLAALHQLGVACERLGRRDEAIAWWQRALKLDPNYYLAQQRLHEIGEGPPPVEPPHPLEAAEFHRLLPLIKKRMRHPKIFRNGGLTLSCQSGVGYVLEDAENPLNGTIYMGGPFNVGGFELEEDLLDFMGMVKMLLHTIDAHNTRDVAILVYYADGSTFNYQARFQRGKRVGDDAHGQFIVTEAPRFFKLRMDSDLVTPYGNPMQGKLIYLSQHPKPAVLVSTLGLEGTR
ncbi:MAG: tetratricopeptide repeat protein [Anaerolineales bacterium]|nr:tetratricopeptide repeat protein [Anaerolineales bacterium]